MDLGYEYPPATWVCFGVLSRYRECTVSTLLGRYIYVSSRLPSVLK